MIKSVKTTLKSVQYELYHLNTLGMGDIHQTTEHLSNEGGIFKCKITGKYARKCNGVYKISTLRK